MNFPSVWKLRLKREWFLGKFDSTNQGNPKLFESIRNQFNQLGIPSWGLVKLNQNFFPSQNFGVVGIVILFPYQRPIEVWSKVDGALIRINYHL